VPSRRWPPCFDRQESKTKQGVCSPDERFAAAHHELRAQMDQAETAFSAALTRLMAVRQLTQAQLAERIGVGQSAIAMLLKRRCRPQRRTLGKLAEALSVPVDELWPGFISLPDGEVVNVNSNQLGQEVPADVFVQS
jgi:DNA-binding XRE family transcriptional regulator